MPTPIAWSMTSNPSRTTSARRLRAPDSHQRSPSSRNHTMAEPVLKFPPDSKGNPDKPAGSATSSKQTLMGRLRRHRRTLLLVVLPIIALVGGVAFYLIGGRYVTTDDA